MGAMEELEKMKSLQVLKASGMDINRVLTMEVVSQASICPWVPKPMVQMSLASLPSSLVYLNLSHSNLTDDAFPSDLSKLSKLQELHLRENPFSSLPNFKDLTSLETLDLSSCPKLQQILWSSTILDYMDCGRCDALEKVTFETGGDIRSIEHLECRNLNHVQGNFKISPVKEIDVELLNSIGFFNLDSMADVEAKLGNYYSGIFGDVVPIQMVNYEYAFHTFFPGREVPQWFSKKNGGSTISFTATLSPHFGFRGLNLCAVYTFLDDTRNLSHLSSRGSFNFRITSRSLCESFSVFLYGIPEKGGDMVWLSHCFEANLFTEGDEVEVSFGCTRGAQIKECGVHLLYFEEQGEVIQYVSTLQRSWDPNLFQNICGSCGGRSEHFLAEGNGEALDCPKGVIREETHEPTPHPSQGSGHEEGAGLEGEPEGEVVSEKGKERVPFELGRLVDSDSDDSVEEISQMPSPGHAIEAIQHMVVLENHVVCSVKILEERAKELAEAKDEAELLRTEADQLKTERGAIERELVAREADLFSARQRVSELEELLRREKEGRSEEVQRSYEEGAKYAKNELQAQVPEIQEKAFTKGWKSCLVTLKVPLTSSVWTEIPSMKRRASSSSSTHVPLAKSVDPTPPAPQDPKQN
ncbi:hypothetical protein RHMOL_Rhmol11G0208700 [Rhododendron molle]|nr:hypothetical protein RHMOL_Rhmol11G0208700 [Rhododendron molle]